MVVDGDRALAVGREDDDAAVVGVDDLVEVVVAEADLRNRLVGVLHPKRLRRLGGGTHVRLEQGDAVGHFILLRNRRRRCCLRRR